MFDFLLNNDLLSAIIAFILVLIPAVLIHELGHFFAAKAVGITILEFGLGLPPRAARLFTLNGTEYTLNWLPLGGFVRPLGEDIVSQQGEDAEQQDRVEARERGIDNPVAVSEAPPFARIFFMAAGALANFVMAIVMFIIIALVGIPETIGARVVLTTVPQESVLAEAGLMSGDIIETINGETFADSTAFMNRLYELSGEVVTLGLLRFDEDLQALLAEGADIPEPTELQISFTPDFAANQPDFASYPIILGVAEDAPADEAGIQPNDLVVSINGTRTNDFNDLRDLTQANLGQEVVLTLLRDGEQVETSLVPRENPPEGEGAMGISSQIEPVVIETNSGLAYQAGTLQTRIVPQPLGDAVGYGFAQTGEVLSLIASVPSQLIQGTIAPEAARPISPIGIAQIGAVSLQDTIEQNQPTIILNFIAIISIALGLTNLLPLPALDGGRIMFVLVEIVRGRPIAPEREGMVHLIGLALLLSLMVVLMLNDLINPVTDLINR